MTTSSAGFFFSRVDVHRDAAPVVVHGDAVILVDDDVDPVAGAGQRLVDRVVDDFVDQVVQRLDVGAADVHARPAAHRLQAFQDLDVLGGVTAYRGVLLRHCHSSPRGAGMAAAAARARKARRNVSIHSCRPW